MLWEQLCGRRTAPLLDAELRSVANYCSFEAAMQHCWPLNFGLRPVKPCGADGKGNAAKRQQQEEGDTRAQTTRKALRWVH